MAEENINPFPEIPEQQRLTTVEDAYVDAYESFKPYQLTEEDVFEQVRSSDSPEEATGKIAETIVDAMVEGYNLPDPVYLKWLKITHPKQDQTVDQQNRSFLEDEEEGLSAEQKELLNITYLKPLRDVKSEFIPKRNSRLSNILD